MNNVQLTIICPAFNDLSLQQLYDLLQLRQEIFVVEQDCPYLDTDGKDTISWHPMAFHEGKIVACTRIVPKGVSYPDAVSIGRVATSQKVRKLGIGKKIMQYSIKKTKELYPGEAIRIGAQTYLIKFYNDLGFQVDGEEYLEDGIPHIEMLLV